MNMNADKDSSDEKSMQELKAKIHKEAEERMKKLRSAEKIDPWAPNPYKQGSEDWWKFQKESFQSLRNIGRKQSQRARERGLKDMRDDPRFAARIQKIKSEHAARRDAARAKLANTNNNKATNDAEMEKKTFDNDIVK